MVQAQRSSSLYTKHHVQASWQVWLRFVTIIITVVAIGLQIKVAVVAFDDDYSYEGPWFSPESFIFLGISLFWNVAELVTRFVLKKGIHPGAHVGVDLILWMGIFSAAVLQFIVNAWYKLAIAAASFKIICCILHFILFIYACIACHRYRKNARVAELAKAVATVQEGQQFELSTTFQPHKSTNIGTFAVPPGMALISTETLAKLQSSVCTKCGGPKVGDVVEV